MANPTFPEEEIDRIKTQRLAAIKQMKADAGYLADTRFAAVVFGENHPYGKPHGGTESSIGAIDQKHLIDFHDEFYVPDNSFMVFAGDITTKDAEKYVGKYFSKWTGRKSQTRRKPRNFPLPPLPAKENKGKIVIVDKPDAVQSALRIGGVGIARNNPDYLKAMVTNTLFGGYFSSRINQNLREVHGYTYGGRSTFDALIPAGVF